MRETSYGFEKQLTGVTPEEAQRRIVEALGAEGFGILTEIDVKSTLERKLGAEFRPYRILGACNPKIAQKALELDPQIGLLLPCNVVVQQNGDTVTVSIADPRAMLRLADNPALEPLVADADARLRRALAALR